MSSAAVVIDAFRVKLGFEYNYRIHVMCFLLFQNILYDQRGNRDNSKVVFLIS